MNLFDSNGRPHGKYIVICSLTGVGSSIKEIQGRGDYRNGKKVGYWVWYIDDDIVYDEEYYL